MSQAYLLCHQDKKKCFAYRPYDGKCIILNDTKFREGKICPFYKEKQGMGEKSQKNKKALF